MTDFSFGRMGGNERTGVVDKISFKRFFQYVGRVLGYTAKDMWGYVRELRDNLLSVIVPVVGWFLLVFLVPPELLKINQINRLTQPLAEYAQGILTIAIIVLTYILRCLFVTPVKMYYEEKKKADKNNWNDVYFKEFDPEEKNLLGWGIKVKNDKLTPIENLSAWLVGMDNRSIEQRRFGYVNNYETDAKPIVSSTQLAEGEETTFIIANHYEHQEGEMEIKAYTENEDYVVFKRDDKCILDIEFRANNFPIKTIRYRMIYESGRWPRLKRYQAKIANSWM
jgi:hypothetical protein